MWTRSIRIQYALPEFVLHPVPNSISCGHAFSVDLPTDFLKHFLTDCIKRSQNPPHQGARSTMKVQVILLLERYTNTSLDRKMLCTSLATDLKVLALSDNNVAGKPRQPENLRNANKKEEMFKSLTNSKCIARVAAHVNKQMYVLWFSLDFLSTRT